jgi:hypothetical protein
MTGPSGAVFDPCGRPGPCCLPRSAPHARGWVISPVCRCSPLAGRRPAAHARRSPGRRGMFRRIIVPLDVSALAEAILPSARTLAHLTGGEIVLLHVAARTERDEGDDGGAPGDGAPIARAYLDDVAPRLTRGRDGEHTPRGGSGRADHHPGGGRGRPDRARHAWALGWRAPGLRLGGRSGVARVAHSDPPRARRGRRPKGSHAGRVARAGRRCAHARGMTGRAGARAGLAPQRQHQQTAERQRQHDHQQDLDQHHRHRRRPSPDMSAIRAPRAAPSPGPGPGRRTGGSRRPGRPSSGRRARRGSRSRYA